MKMNLGLLLDEIEKANKDNTSMIVFFNDAINIQTKRNGLLLIKKLRAFRLGLK